jgi:hypothetical protein
MSKMHSNDPDFDVMLMTREQAKEEAIRLRKENRELREIIAAAREKLEASETPFYEGMKILNQSASEPDDIMFIDDNEKVAIKDKNGNIIGRQG